MAGKEICSRKEHFQRCWQGWGNHENIEGPVTEEAVTTAPRLKDSGHRSQGCGVRKTSRWDPGSCRLEKSKHPSLLLHAKSPAGSPPGSQRVRESSGQSHPPGGQLPGAQRRQGRGG